MAAAEFQSWKKQHGITWSTILLAMERSWRQQYGVQQDAKALWDQLKQEYKSKVKLNMWASQDEMSAVELRDCENVREYASNIQGYVNDFNLCADSSTGTMPKSEHSYYLVQGIPKDDDWRFVTQLMYDKIDTLANEPAEIVMKMIAHQAWQHHEVNLESIELLALTETWTKSEKRNSKQTRKSQKSGGGGSVSDGSRSESEKDRHRNWRDTQECYRCHQVEHIARYCSSTAPVQSSAATESAAAAAAMTLSIEDYGMTTTGREAPLKESWYIYCAATSHIRGDRQTFKHYTKFSKRVVREIRNVTGRVAGKAIVHGYV
jgi:hypothetical protein